MTTPAQDYSTKEKVRADDAVVTAGSTSVLANGKTTPADVTAANYEET
jgi:hypothetical protein